MVIDGHVHVWPDAIAKQALAAAPSALQRFGDGTLASATDVLERAEIDLGVCLGVAPTAKTVEAANRFAGSLSGRFIGFGSIHPDLSPDENLSSLERHALKGVKVHPVFQGYALNDRRLWAIFEALGDRYVVIAHVGGAGSDHAGSQCTPDMVMQVVQNFPRLKLVACHFGGYQRLDDAENTVIGLPVHVDTSWPPSLAVLDPARIKRLIDRHGADRVCFASDWPMADPKQERLFIESLGLPGAATEQILGGNLAALMEL